MPYITLNQKPAFKQAQNNVLRENIDKVHTQLVERFGLPDDHDTHLMVSEMLKALALDGKCITN